MRKNILQLIIAFSIPVLFFSCFKEDIDNLTEIEKYKDQYDVSMAQVNFVHAYTALTLNSVSTTSTGFRITMDGIKVNGAGNSSSSTNTLMYGGTFPVSRGYSFLPPGQHNFKFILNRVSGGNFTATGADEIFSTNVNLVVNKKYSMIIADPYSAPNVLILDDDYVVPGKGGFAIRFVNLSGDVTAKYDIISNRHGMLFSNVSNTELKKFKYLGVPAIGDTLVMKLAGTNTVVADIKGFFAAPQAVYTIYARGKTGVTNRAPGLGLYTNR